MIKHLNGELVIGDKKDKIKNSKRNQKKEYYLNTEKIKYYLELDKYNNPTKRNFKKKYSKF